MSHKVSNSVPLTRISTRKSIEFQPSNKHSDTDTKVRVITGRHDRRKQTLKTILRDEAPVFLSHEEVVDSNSLQKARKPSKNRQKSEDLSRPPLRGGLMQTNAKCIQVTEEVGKALRTGAWQNRKEDIGSLSYRNKQSTNCNPDVMSVDSAVSRKRMSTIIQPHKESSPAMFSKVRENRKASRCCAECKSVVFDREKLRLRGALGVKICDACWSKKKPKEGHVAAQNVVPRAPSPSVKKCLVKLFDVSRYPVGHPFGKGFLSQRSLKRRFDESQAVDDTASEMIVQPKRARRSGSSTFPAEFVNTLKTEQLGDSKQNVHVNSGRGNETVSKEGTRTASNSRNVSRITADVIISNKNEKTNRRKSDESAAENIGQEKLEGKLPFSQLKVNAQRSPERRISRKSNVNTETITKTRTTRRSSSNNESASEKKTLRKSGLNAEDPSGKRMTQKGIENVESPTEKKRETTSTNAELSFERKSRRSSINAEATSQKKTPHRSRMNVETTSENTMSRRSSINAEVSEGKKTSRSSRSTETTPARVSRRNSVNTETASEIRSLRRNSHSNESSGTRTKRQTSISNNLSKSALPVRIQNKNKNLPVVLRKGHNQVISSGKSKTAAANLETKTNRNTSKIQLQQIKSSKLRKVQPEAVVAKRSLIKNNNKKPLVLQQNKLKTAVPVISRKGIVLPKYSKPAEKPNAKRILTKRTDDLKNRKSLSRGGSGKKSVFGKLRSKITTVRHIKKPNINTVDTSLSEKTAAARKRKMDLPDKSPGIKKRKIERVPVRRKQTPLEKEFTRTKNFTYKCDVCDKKYSSLAEERLHELSHTGRQPILVLHKCDSPQGVLSLIREDDFSSLNICGSDSEIPKDVSHEVNRTNDVGNTEMIREADIGTVPTLERKYEDACAIQLENLENTDEQTKQNINKSFEMVETDEVCETDHEKSIQFDNCNVVSVLKAQEIEYGQQRIHSDTDICPTDEMDKNKTDTVLENTSASKTETETLKQSSDFCSPEIAKKPKSSDEIAVLLEEIFGESSEEDLISVTGIRNLRQTADAVNSGMDKTSESSTEKPPYGVNSLQHTSVNQNLRAVLPKSSPSDTAEAVTRYLKGETHNPEEILRQLNYGDKTVSENETKTSAKTSCDTEQPDTSIKLPGDVESNSHRDCDGEGGSTEASRVTSIEGKDTTVKDIDEEGRRPQLIVDDESEALDNQQVQSQDETVSLINTMGDTLEISTDITDNRNQNLKDSTDISAVGGNNDIEDMTSDDMPVKVDISVEANKDFPNGISKDNSVTIPINGSRISESSCKQLQNEKVNQNVGQADACIGSTEISPEHKYKADSGDKQKISILEESVNQEQQQKTAKQEKQVLLDTTNNAATHEILETSSNDKCDESELPSEICHEEKTMLECQEKEQFKSQIHFQVEDDSESIINVEQVDSDSETKDQKVVQQVECIDNSDLLNKQNSSEVSEVTKTECYVSEQCDKDTSIGFKTSIHPENDTHAISEGTPPTGLLKTDSSANEISSTKDSLEDPLQNETCEDEVGTAGNGVIKDVLVAENNEAKETLDRASPNTGNATETDSRSITLHSPSEATTIENMEIDTGKNSNDTVPKPDGLEVKDTELDLLAQPDSVLNATQEIKNSHKTNMEGTTCDVPSVTSDHKIIVSGTGSDIDCEDISTTLDSGPEVKIDTAEQGVGSSDSGHNVEAENTSCEEKNVMQPEPLDPEHELQVLKCSDDLNIEFAHDKVQTFNDSHEIQATNDINKGDGDDGCSPYTDHDEANSSDKSHQFTVQDPSKEGTPVDVYKNSQSVDSTNLGATKEGQHCEMEPQVPSYGVDTTGKSEEVEAESTVQKIESIGSSCDGQAVVSTCDDRTDDVNCEVETRHVNSEIEIKKSRQCVETANADHEVQLVSASEVASDEVVVALDAGSEADVLAPEDEDGADVQFVPSGDLNTNSEITAGISDCCPSIVGVENLSFNVRHSVPDVFEEEEQILQEVGDHSILQESDSADRSEETLTKGQNEIQEAEIEDSVKPPLVVGLNGMNEKVIDECSPKMSGGSDLKDNLHLAVSGDNDITGLEPISDDELDFI